MPRTVERSFYYWQSTYDPGNYQKKLLDSLHVNQLYIKYFDVDWDEASRQPLPKAMIRFRQQAGYNIVPTVFITNECLQQMDTAQVHALATRIIETIGTINSNNSIDSIKEIQLDCDWSAGTREKYFNLLIHIRNGVSGIRHQGSGIKLSATIRLYQIKYKQKAGIPPVDKGMLMCYNMGNLKSIRSNNSIIETAELKKYIDSLSSYPLPLDIALPVFNWKVWFRNGQYHGITEEFPDTLLSSPLFNQINNRYQVLRDTLLAGYEFKKGDQLRYENSEPAEVIKAATMISERLKNTRLMVVLYQLDSVLLKKYSFYELENIYNSMR